jgi:hypothetical protein
MAVGGPSAAVGTTVGAARILTALALSLIVLAALAIRLPELGRSLWIDELITDWATSAGPGELIGRSWIANLSPAFFSFAWLSRDLLGASESALRLPSLIAGLLLIVALWACFRELGVATWAALVGCALAAFDPNAFEYAVTARPVAFVALGSLLHTLAFLRIMRGSRTPRADWIAWVGFHAFCFYLHYTALVALAGQGAYVLLARPQRAGQWRRFAIAGAVLAALCLPALGHLEYLFTNRGTLGHTPAEELSEVFAAFFPDRYLLIPLLIAGFLPELWDRSGRGWFDPPALARRREDLRCLTILYASPMLLVWALGKLHVVQLSQYRVYCWALPLLLFGVVASALARRDRRVIFAASAAALMAVYWESPLHHYARFGDFGAIRIDWRAAIERVREGSSPGDAVLIDSGLVETAWLTADSPPLLRSYLLSPVGGLYALDVDRLHVAPVSLDLAWLDRELPARLAAGGSGWLVAPSGHAELHGALVSRLAQEGIPVELEGPIDVGGVGVSRLWRAAGRAQTRAGR